MRTHRAAHSAPARSRQDSLLLPYLGAYNKRAGATLSVDDLERIEIDGVVCEDPGVDAASVLLSESPAVVLTPRSVPAGGQGGAAGGQGGAAGGQGGVVDAQLRTAIESKIGAQFGGGVPRGPFEIVDALLALPLDASEGAWAPHLVDLEASEAECSDCRGFSARHGVDQKARLVRSLLARVETAESDRWRSDTLALALRCLRVLSREGAHDDDLRADGATVTVCRLAGLAEDGAEWDEARAEACVLLSNLLTLGGERATRLLRDRLGAEARLHRVLGSPEEQPVPRLRLHAALAFRLTLAPPSGQGLDDFAADACRALRWVASRLELRAADASTLALGADLVRATFNLMRALAARPVAAAGLDGSVLEAVVTILGAGRGAVAPGGGEEAAAALLELQRTSLQLPMVMAEERAAFGAGGLGRVWRGLVALLPPSLAKVEAGEPDSKDEPALPCVALTKVCEQDAASRRQVLDALFPPEEEAGFDAATFRADRPLPAGASLRMHLVKSLTSTHYVLKRVVGDMIWAACDGDAREVVRLCGLGSAAGVLQEKGMLAQMQAEEQAKAARDGA